MNSILLFMLFFLVISISRDFSVAQENVELAEQPPRGWNSYDSFGWVVSERTLLQNAKAISQRLLPHGYQYVVVDYLWYRKYKDSTTTQYSLGLDHIDKWGRLIPDPERWPSSKGGKGFTEVAKKIHDMGLKFGIHVMTGISAQAYNANTPILDPIKGGDYVEFGRTWTAQDIGLHDRTCTWAPGFMSVNTTLGAGRAFLRSLYRMYAEWGVDFVKHDCVFGNDLDAEEISVVSKVLKELNRPMLYSVSPGTSVTPNMAKYVSTVVNMYRIAGDDWDTWRNVEAHFDVSGQFAAANMIGANSTQGKSWPDLDMLPLGWLTDPEANHGPNRKCNLTLDEQRTQMTLWSMAKSPLMFGGDVRKLDETTYNIITNPNLLEINSYSTGNKEFPYVSGIKASLTHRLGLGSCRHQRAIGWESNLHPHNTAGKICWNDIMGRKSKRPFCLYKRRPHLTLNRELLHGSKYQGKLQLLAKEMGAFCLNAAPRRKLTSKDTKTTTFSRCTLHTGQIWELHENGTLENSYSHLCAKVTVREKFSSVGIRSWIASGRRGEIYLSFFNLNSARMVVSAEISNLAKAFPSRNLRSGSCNYTEVWSGRSSAGIQKTISMILRKHACALFILHCS